MSKDDGGAAFPSPGVVIDYDKNEHQQGAYEGMSLRDYFAAKAMNGFLANAWQAETLASLGESAAQQMAAVAEISYAMADAMLVERAK